MPERAKNDSPDLPQFSRMEGYRLDWTPDWAGQVPKAIEDAFRAEYMPEMPPLNGGRYLLDYLLDVGPVVAGGMSAAPITSRELMPWCEETGIHLHPWEAKIIRRLSRDYLAESDKAGKRNCPPPWRPEIN